MDSGDYFLFIVILLLNGCLHETISHWSIDGNCTEPQPISNTYRKVKDNNVIYSCVSGSFLESGSLRLTCDPETGNYTNNSSLPECRLSCGNPLTWSWAVAVEHTGNGLDDYVKYECSSQSNDKVSVRATCSETHGGWKSPYPSCPEEENFADAMDFVFESGTFGMQGGDCVFALSSFGSGSVSLVMETSSTLIDVKTVGFRIDQSVDNSWLQDACISFFRFGTSISTIEILPSHVEQELVTVSLDNEVRGINAINIGSESNPAVGFCSPVVRGRKFEGGCGDPIPPFKANYEYNDSVSYNSGDKVVFECFDDYHYIGGSKEYLCNHRRRWTSVGRRSMECTDRDNRAIGSSFTADIVPLTNSAVSYPQPLQISGVFENSDVSKGHYVSLPGYAESVTLTVELGKFTFVERLTIQFSGDMVVSSVQLFYNSDDEIGKNCTESEAHQYKFYRTFFCHTHPVVKYIQIRIQTQSASVTSADWTVESLVIIGEHADVDREALECYTGEHGNGSDYQGRRNTSTDGDACLPWTGFTYDLSAFPDRSLENASNFCRNPDPESHSNPFCMTSSGPKPCAVPPCALLCATDVRGDEYAGHINVSEENTTCMPWTNSEFSFIRISEFPDSSVDEARNFCRNPAGSQSKPWCYVSSDPVRTEHCNIPSCPTSAAFGGVITQTGREEYEAYVKGRVVVNCFMFDELSLATGESAWVDVEEDKELLTIACTLLGPGAFVTLVCVEQKSITDEFVWRDFILVCPGTTAISKTGTTAAQTPIAATSTTADVPNTSTKGQASTIVPIASTPTTPSTPSTPPPPSTPTTPSSSTASTLASSSPATASSSLSSSSTQPSLSTTSVSHNPYTQPAFTNCTCSCPTTQNLTVDSETMDRIRQRIVEELTVDKTQLSATVRSKTSAQDDRESAVTTGYVGVAIMISVTLSIVTPDAILLLNKLLYTSL